MRKEIEEMKRELEALVLDVDRRLKAAEGTVKGTVIIPTSVEDAQEIEKWAKEKEEEIQKLSNDISQLLEEKDLSDEEKEKLEYIDRILQITICICLDNILSW